MKDLDNILALANKLPTTVKKNAVDLVTKMGSAIEGIGDTPVEWKPPIAKVIQGTSDRSNLPKTVQIGSIMVGEDVLQQPARIIPIRSWTARQYWSPDQNEAKMLCSSPDGVVGYMGYNCKECPHSKWEDGKSDCSKVKQVAVITSDLSKLFILNFAKTAYNVGTEWEKQMKQASCSTFKRLYDLTTETHKQYKNVEALAVQAVTPSEGKTAEEYIEFLQALFNKFTDDRQEHLQAFHLMVKNKGEKLAALTGSTAPAAITDETVVEVAEVTPAQAQSSSKYAM